jgi:hypothetical protein
VGRGSTHNVLLGTLQGILFDPNIVCVYYSFLIVILKKGEGNLVVSQQLFESFSTTRLSIIRFMPD